MATKLIQAFLLAVALSSQAGCGMVPDIKWDALKQSVQLEGDIRCEGSGSLTVLGSIRFGIDGTAGANMGSHASENVCAGIQLYLGPWKWTWVSSVQDTGFCQGVAGTLRLEQVQGAAQHSFRRSNTGGGLVREINVFGDTGGVGGAGHQSASSRAGILPEVIDDRPCALHSVTIDERGVRTVVDAWCHSDDEDSSGPGE